ncbi:MAG: VWA domain-containing protein [Planctomycetota bacterium]|nr:VWA domain-containing protein [Planctomycetota bacterium]
MIGKRAAQAFTAIFPLPRKGRVTRDLLWLVGFLVVYVAARLTLSMTGVLALDSRWDVGVAVAFTWLAWIQITTQKVFPAPRRPFVWRDALSLVIFLLVYVGVCIGLEVTNQLLFGRPIAFALMAVSVWIWWMNLAGKGGLSKGRSMAALWIRLALVGVFVMVIAEPRAVRTRDVLSVVYAIDISDSIGDASVDKALEFVAKHAVGKWQNDEVGIVVFGGTAAVEIPPRESFDNFEPIIASRVRRDATNIEQALSLASAMLPEENRGRIVLVSDGTSTSGSLSQILDELKAKEIAVDVLPIDYQYDREVWIEALELPQYLKVGQDYSASVVMSSLQDGDGTLRLSENGQEIAEAPVKFRAGMNRFEIPLRLRDAGYYEYAATIEVSASQDNLRQNNTVVNYLYVEGDGKVLVVTDPEGETEDWKPLVDALKAADRAVALTDPFNFPSDALSLMPYDSIVFVNVARNEFDEAQLRAVHDSVKDLGTGFLMVGGPKSFGPGGYHETDIEKCLPVSMDVSQKKVLPKGALAIILHTCEFPDGNTWGKRITKQAMKVLMPQDEIGVLVYSYNGKEEWLFELTPRSEMDKLVQKINGAQIGDMPSFARTMKLGLEGLKKSDAAARHMIIISDGDPSPPSPKLVQEFVDNKISISMVAVFPHGGQDISKMNAIAGATGGRYYFPSDPNQLPAIFIKESRTLKRKMIQEKKLTPEVGMASPILKGVETMSPVYGYVLTSIKPEAEPILQTPLGNEEGEDENDPILAKWRYGLGATAAFTSDFSSKWGKDWQKWDKFRPVIKQLITDISRVKEPGHLRLWSYPSGGDGVVLVEDFHADESFLEIAALVSGPSDETRTVTLRQISPRRYQARVPQWGPGRYQIIAKGVGSGREETVTGGFIVPYSPEYLRFRSNPIVLDEIRNRTGGSLFTPDTPASEIFEKRDPKRSSNPVFDWFLLALACLLPLDVAMRRIQIDLWAVKNLFKRKKAGPSTATMGSLLQRKQEVGARLDSARKESLGLQATSNIPRATRPVPTRKVDVPNPETTLEKPERKSTSGGTTTSRLLDAKRKRQEDEEGS